MLKKTTIVGAFIKEFQRFVVIIMNVDNERLTYLFMYRLQESMRSSLKAMEAPMLATTICKGLVNPRELQQGQ